MTFFEKPTAEFPNACFALLDDSDASRSDPRSRLYTGLVDVLDCRLAADLPALFNRMQQKLKGGKQAIGLFAYELGIDLLQIGRSATYQPLAQILIFDRCAQLSREEADIWLTNLVHKSAATTNHPSGIANKHASVNETEFAAALEKIHEYIQAGDTYQVNYTYRLRFDAYGSLPDLYLKLRARQPAPYGALVALPDGRAILSFSPELFVRHQQGLITARPMKGTAPATGVAARDAAVSAALAEDSKNRAENLMIVDLLRNDLGRIAATGSVHVPALFDVNRYGGVLQMTSTVQAQLREDVTLSDIFRGIFPCGSITGAPKHRTMQIIHELEPEMRGLYTGAIGWFDAPTEERDIGDFCLSVPIRTLALQAPGNDGRRAGEMGVGAGIVHDSKMEDEYAECQLKSAFLSGLQNDFDLFETMYATQTGGCRNLELHIQRLQASALYFGFPFDDAALRNILNSACVELPPASAHRIRLSLGNRGFNLHVAPLQPLNVPVRTMLAKQPVSADNLFMRHKSTVRKHYDDAILEAEKRGAFDMLFFNTHGELTEGGRSNVFVKLDGHWYTPPLSAGILPGVMRSVLLADPEWNAKERRLTVADLRAAEQLVLTNALRGAIVATVAWESEAATG